MMNAFITGVSRGIGLGLTRKAIEQGFRVFGVARHPEDSKELTELRHQYPEKLEILKLDLRDDQASHLIQKAIRHYPHFDLLINNAGIYEKGESKEEFLRSFEVNSYLPLMITQSLLPKLKNAKAPKAIHLSSMMGSITDNNSGGSYAYRSSKSALNMINKSLSIDFPWLTTIVVHPGWVQTRMGGVGATTSVQESTNGLWKVIEKIEKSESGQFIDFQGRQLAW
jgi:NAD(P)-dependent dehydrogenase (short-subunit alcohol dehydrogenase family)